MIVLHWQAMLFDRRPVITLAQYEALLLGGYHEGLGFNTLDQ